MRYEGTNRNDEYRLPNCYLKSISLSPTFFEGVGFAFQTMALGEVVLSVSFYFVAVHSSSAIRNLRALKAHKAANIHQNQTALVLNSD